MCIEILQIFFLIKKEIKSEENFEHLTLQEKKSDYLERKIMERACSIYI